MLRHSLFAVAALGASLTLAGVAGAQVPGAEASHVA